MEKEKRGGQRKSQGKNRRKKVLNYHEIIGGGGYTKMNKMKKETFQEYKSKRKEMKNDQSSNSNISQFDFSGNRTSNKENSFDKEI